MTVSPVLLVASLVPVISKTACTLVVDGMKNFQAFFLTTIPSPMQAPLRIEVCRSFNCGYCQPLSQHPCLEAETWRRAWAY
jgi:hypothetical protein